MISFLKFYRVRFFFIKWLMNIEGGEFFKFYFSKVWFFIGK